MTIVLIAPPFKKPWGNYLLENIVETTAPENISWFPQTLGWKILACVIFFTIIKQLYLAYKKYKRNAYRREALAWLAQYQNKNDLTFYQQLPVLLRKIAISAFDRTEISQLSGNEWEQWLDEHCSKCNFSTRCPNALHHLAYSPIEPSTVQNEQHQEVLRQVTLWIKFHRSPDA